VPGIARVRSTARAPHPLVLVAAACALLTVAAGACSQIPPHLILPSVPITDPSWRAMVAGHVSAPIVGGNRVDVLQDGEEIFSRMLAAIAAARRSVTYEHFLYKRGEVSEALTERLVDRCRAGVRVHVLIDAYGARFMPDEYATRLRRAGCEVVDDFRPLLASGPRRANARTHRRVLVVDGRVGFTGGSGASPRWPVDGSGEERWRETDVRIEGPAVHYLQGAFAEHWREATGVVLGGDAYYPPLPPSGSVDVQIVRSSPIEGNHAIYTLLLLAVAGARRSVHITNQYIVLDDRMAGELVNAKRRGVDIVLIISAVPTNSLVYAVERAALGALLAAGLEIYEYTAGPLHTKAMVVDGIWSTIGSTNLDPRSFALNDELNAVFHDREIAGRMEAMFAADLARSRRVTLESWRERRLLRMLGRLLAPIRGQL
jgi:cardiolipin synthase A/B